MRTITRTVVTVEVTPPMLRANRITLHEAQLDGDEGLEIGVPVFVYDGDVTYLSAVVTAHDGDLWELTLRRDDGVSGASRVADQAATRTGRAPAARRRTNR